MSLKPMKYIKKYLTKDQIDTMIGLTDSLRDKLLIHLLSRTGRRVGEIVRLKYSDILWNEKKVIWNIEKKKGEYRIPLTIDQETLDLLGRYIELYYIGKDDYIFHSYDKNTPLTVRRIEYIVRRYGKKIGEEWIHPHVFRHSFAIHFVKNMTRPDQIFQLKKLLQHEDIRMTMFYAEFFSDKELEETIEHLWQ